MRNEFLNELKSVAMESVGLNDSIDMYAGSEVAEELITLDILDAHAVAMESYEEALFAETFEAQEMALESADLTFGEISKFNGELSMESIVNAAKRGAYGVQIQVKKIAQKIIKFVMSIINYFTVADGKFKSYNKLFKKYKDKLSKLNPSGETGDKDEKEYTIRDWSSLASEFTKFKNETKYDQLKRVVEACSGLNPTDMRTALLTLVDAGKYSASMSEEDVDKALEDWKSDLKDDLDDIKSEQSDRDTVDGTFQELKSKVMSWAEQAKSDTAKDIKYKGELKKIRNKMNQLTKDVKKENEAEADVIRMVNKISTAILTGIQKKATLRYKLLTSGYQGLLADMAKLISAGTKVND